MKVINRKGWVKIQQMYENLELDLDLKLFFYGHWGILWKWSMGRVGWKYSKCMKTWSLTSTWSYFLWSLGHIMKVVYRKGWVKVQQMYENLELDLDLKLFFYGHWGILWKWSMGRVGWKYSKCMKTWSLTSTWSYFFMVTGAYYESGLWEGFGENTANVWKLGAWPRLEVTCYGHWGMLWKWAIGRIGWKYSKCMKTWSMTSTWSYWVWSIWPRTPSIFLALNFCSLTDYQKLWHNCSLFVKTFSDRN